VRESERERKKVFLSAHKHETRTGEARFLLGALLAVEGRQSDLRNNNFLLLLLLVLLLHGKYVRLLLLVLHQ
jgi:hypothetical protein